MWVRTRRTRSFGVFLRGPVKRFNAFTRLFMRQSKKQPKCRGRHRFGTPLIAVLPLTAFASAWCRAQDVSAPVILQDFENTYGTIENRMADVFAAGYGTV